MSVKHIVDYKGFDITFLARDHQGLINATEMAKPFSKQPKDFLKGSSTKRYIKALENYYSQKDIPPSGINNIHKPQIIKVLHIQNGGLLNGTWMDKKLALRFAQWLSPDFAIWVDVKVEELLTTGTTSIKPLSRIEMLEELIAAERKTIELKETIDMQQPKVEVYDDLMSLEDTWSVGEVSKQLGVKGLGPHKLFQYLRDAKILISTYQPYSYYMESGWFYIRQYKLDKGDSQEAKIQVRLTQRGIDLLRARLTREGYECNSTITSIAV